MKTVIAALFLLVTGSLAVVAQSSEKIFLPENVQFPTIEGWRAGQVTPMPAGDSGIVINYDSLERERATVYVYSRGKSVGGDLKGVIKDEFEGAKNALKTLVDMGIYSNLKVVKSDTVALGTPTGSVKALYAQITFDAKGIKFTSEIFVFPYRSHVVKLRLSRPEGLAADAAGYLRFRKAIDDLFSQ